MIGREAKKYFWDVDPATLDLSAHKKYIIERVLDMGDEQAVAWLRQNFSLKDIEAVAKISKRLSPKSKNFWTLMAPNL